MIILPVDGAPRAEVRVSKHAEKDRVVVFRNRKALQIQLSGLFEVGRSYYLALVNRRVGEMAGGHRTDNLAPLQYSQLSVFGHAAYNGGSKLKPFGDA